MTFNYIDIHSHLYFAGFDTDREEEILKLKQNKIATITVGVDFETSEKAIELSQKHENLFATVGMHPGDLNEQSVFDDRLIELASHKKVVAIGECGLDYYRLPPDNLELKTVQKKICQLQIDLALNLDKPLMLHIRPQKGTQDAYDDALDILENYKKMREEKLRGNAHFFVGNLDVLKRFFCIGFTVSFGGVITFARDYDDVIKYAPLNMIMSETDTPFVAPVPFRGKRNSPLYVSEVVKKIAEIRGEDLEKVRIALRNNGLKYIAQDLLS